VFLHMSCGVDNCAVYLQPSWCPAFERDYSHTVQISECLLPWSIEVVHHGLTMNAYLPVPLRQVLDSQELWH
jgi:hypothetical protein